MTRSVIGAGVDAPAVPPVAVRDVRGELAAEFLRGRGIEIGALHLPMVLPAGASVRYVDRMSVPELRAHYPELAELDLARVDIVDDGERLGSIADASVDFIVANHFLEHCEDPIRTIETHLGKLRPGGVLFYAVPDKRYTFDFRRTRTPLEHVVADHENGPEGSRSEHYLDWVRLVYESGHEPPDEQEIRRRAADLEASGYSIHFHVWTQADLLELMLHCRERFQSFEIEAVRIRSLENILVLRKHGELLLEPEPVTTLTQNGSNGSAVRAQAQPIAAAAVSPAPDKVPLAALRMKLDAGSAASHWSVDVDDVPGRALLQPAACEVTFPLRLAGAVSLRGRVMLMPHDWRDGTGALRASVQITEEGGRRRQLWSGVLGSAAELGHPDGVHIACELPPSSTGLVLGVEQHAVRDGGAVGRVLWIEPALNDPSAPAIPQPHTPPPASTPRPPTEHPLISVLTPVHDPPLEMLEEAIASVRSQTFTDWELHLVDDGSRDPEIIHALQRHTASDPRIHLHRREKPGGISTATNTALQHATGEYIALLDHDDTLEPHALDLIAQQLDTNPALDMIYTDEDVVASGRRTARHLKPDWSPENFCAFMYTCHLGVYRRALVSDIGGFRSEFDGCQDYDLVLRLMERTDRIAHVPQILYHWRAHASSTAGGDAKPYAYVAQSRAIAAHLRRTGENDADVQLGAFLGLHRVVHRVDPALSVAIVLAVENEHGLTEAARSWRTQPHPNWELVLAAPPQSLPACTNALTTAGINPARTTALPAPPGTDLPTALANAARAATAEHLLLMQAPAAGLTHDWLRRLIGYSLQPAIAASGPILLNPDGRIQDAGIALPDGIPLHLLHGLDGAGGPPVVMNLSAVSGVLATRRETFEGLGGLDPQLGDLALIDYCRRATEANLRIVTVPDARLRSTVPDSSPNDLPRIWQFRRAWFEHHTHDPYYSPGYRPDRGDFAAVPSGEVRSNARGYASE